MASKNFKSVLENLPKVAGVYRYYDLKGSLLYIGKAKNLKNRVTSYFTGKPTNARTALMVSLINRIEYSEVKNEKEALILEASLINSLQPKYNIKLKDDKSFVYIEYTKTDPIPGFFIVRRKENLGSTYFGPYVNTRAIEEFLKILRMAFPYCKNRLHGKQKCQYCSINQCDGICVGLESMDYYLEKNKQIISILQGKNKPVILYLRSKMQDAVDSENYSLAGFFRDHIKNIEKIADKQKIVLSSPQDLDIISVVYEDQDEGSLIASFYIQQIRNGQVVNVYNTLMEGNKEEESENQILGTLNVFLDNYLLKNSTHYPLIINVSKFG
jgi:excinuclease ABC subunit C